MAKRRWGRAGWQAIRAAEPDEAAERVRQAWEQRYLRSKPAWWRLAYHLGLVRPGG